MEVQAEMLRKDNNLTGYLRRAGKAGKTFGLRRKRFYSLDGAILSKHLNEHADATWHVNVQESEVVQLGKHHFVLSLSREETSIATRDFEQNTVVLYARTEEECCAWVASLKYAAHRKLENHYELGPLIGEGGFAKVRLGRCALTGEHRAIKTMQKSQATAKLFGNEIAILKRVSHPNIVKTYDVYETNSEIHIVMEYMEGGMLYDAIEDGVRFDEDDVAEFMRELIDGILYLHRTGIVHRDMKPENVLCTSKDVPLHVKIADFGLSSITSIAEVKANQMVMSTMIGTPEFVAPEIANREEYTEKVDIWALGMLCYNVICGQLPLDENADLLPQIRNGVDVSFLEPEWESYSEKSKSFVSALLCTDAEKRPTALACLVHPWLDSRQVGASRSVAQYGRVSKYLVEASSRKASLGFGLRGCGVARSPEEVKKLWIIAFLAVAAANRFAWLVDRDHYAICKQQAKRYAFKCRMQDDCASTRTSEMSERSGVPPKSVCTREMSETDDECVSGRFPQLEGMIDDDDCGEQHGARGKRDSGSRGRKVFKKESFLGDVDEPKRVRSLDNRLNSHDSMAKGKASLRNKLIAALASEGGKLGPVRKLSKRFGKKGDGVKRSGSSKMDGVDLELGLDALDVADADDTDALGLDRQDSADSAQPASLFGRKHRMLMKKQKDLEVDEASPVTPRKGLQ